MAAAFLSGLVILRRSRRDGSWKSAQYLGFGMVLLGTVNAAFLIRGLSGTVAYRPSPVDIVFLPLSAVFLVPVKMEFAEHFPKQDRREIAADVALIAAALGSIAFLYLKPEGTDAAATMSAAAFALIGVTAFATYGALALWVPTPAHIGQFAVIGAFSAAVLTFGAQWVDGTYVGGEARIDLPFALGALALAGLVTALPRAPQGPVVRPSRYGRPLLTAAAVAAASAALGIVAAMEVNREVESVQGSALIAILAAAMAVRILVNQLRSTQATRQAESALDQKEAALRETDLALARLQEANETLRESEERLRLVFEAAVDGIVELDEKDVILRANEAFCQMVQFPRSLIEGQPWTALAAAIEAEESFASLPATGQGTLRREGHAFYLEARTSDIPGTPPRRLLLVRDVTAARVADQTIRSLFKFLQDRDEDRTRLLRRTNAAIESERNRIARDLHDGPVQGVSAASLSLEAVLLMLKAGELEEGLEILSKVRRELSEEADNLRRLMAGLRPPLLEERGLAPAIRETLDKFGRDNDVETNFVSRSLVEVPGDLETLAYRIVQEALSNAGKHARAKKIYLTVEAVAGQLRIEVADDGVGFEAAKSREFLRDGRVGLASMRERVELANGTFMVHTTPGRGTTVLATLPLDTIPAPRELAV
ncbi:MAG: PAS domain S-box protein, partial [Actinobacteria bacterium]|nr:PAS domain S-box protein [Actinomycetota bacterium]